MILKTSSPGNKRPLFYYFEWFVCGTVFVGAFILFGAAVIGFTNGRAKGLDLVVVLGMAILLLFAGLAFLYELILRNKKQGNRKK